jgi:hypothetical protein
VRHLAIGTTTKPITTRTRAEARSAAQFAPLCSPERTTRWTIRWPSATARSKRTSTTAAATTAATPTETTRPAWSRTNCTTLRGEGTLALLDGLVYDERSTSQHLAGESLNQQLTTQRIAEHRDGEATALSRLWISCEHKIFDVRKRS